MRIVSLMPAATEIVYALGMGDRLVGRTHRCDYPAEVEEVPVVTIDDPQVAGHSVEPALLAELEPDLVLADGSEDDPLVDYAYLSRVVGGLRREITLVALAPLSVEGMLNAISTVGAYTEAEYEAIGQVEVLRKRLRDVEPGASAGRGEPGPTRRVVVLEGLDPLLTAGRWVPEMVRLAGGWDLLGRDGEPSTVTTWAAVRDVEPELLILALREHDAAGAFEALRSTSLPGWFDELEAVREGQSFAVDGHGLFSRPGPRLVEGVGVLAELFDPVRLAGTGPVASWMPLSPVGITGERRSPSAD